MTAPPFPPPPFPPTRVRGRAGEEGGPNYVRQALKLLGADRIDHGIRSLEDPVLVEAMAEMQARARARQGRLAWHQKPACRRTKGRLVSAAKAGLLV